MHCSQCWLIVDLGRDAPVDLIDAAQGVEGLERVSPLGLELGMPRVGGLPEEGVVLDGERVRVAHKEGFEDTHNVGEGAEDPPEDLGADSGIDAPLRRRVYAPEPAKRLEPATALGA